MIVIDYMMIRVKIDGVRYPLKVLRKDEFLYREAAKMVNEKINLYRLNYKEAGSLQHWSMTAFDLAFAVVKNREDEKESGLRTRIEQLEKELEKCRNNKRE